MRIPTLIDFDQEVLAAMSNRESRGGLRLVFAGSPGRERWDIILAAIQKVRQKGYDVRLDVFGLSRERFLSNIGKGRPMAELLGDCLVAHGRIPREEYLDAVRHCDFLIMLRDDSRSTQACFPTKVAEFMAAGTPVITNAHSDLSVILNDGVEAIIVADTTLGAMVAALERASLLRQEDLLRMKENAYRRAREVFDYRNYITPLVSFLRDAGKARS